MSSCSHAWPKLLPLHLHHLLPNSFPLPQKLDGRDRRAQPVLFGATLLLALASFVFAPNYSQALSPLRPAHAAATWQEATLRYRMVSGHTTVGEMTIEVNQDPSQGLIYVVESVSGLLERSTVLTLRDDAALHPVASHTVFGRDPRFQVVSLQYGKNRVAGEITQPEEYGGTHQIDLPLAPATQDYFAVPHLLCAGPLHVNQTLTIPIFDFHQRHADYARAWVSKRETIAVPAGEFTCLRVEGFSGKIRWILLIEEESPHRLIKQIFPALDLEFDLAGYQTGDRGDDEAISSSSLRMH